MYRCGNKAQIGDAISVEVKIDVSEIEVSPGMVALVLEIDSIWGDKKNPLLTVKFATDEIQQIPASWCILCARK